MGILDKLTSAFINTFGITQPTDATRRQASWFIMGMLSLILVGLCVGTAIIFRALHL